MDDARRLVAEEIDLHVAACVMVRAEHDTAAALTMLALFRTRFTVAVPADMSIVPAVARVLAISVAHVAVPVASADESCVIAFCSVHHRVLLSLLHVTARENACNKVQHVGS